MNLEMSPITVEPVIQTPITAIEETSIAIEPVTKSLETENKSTEIPTKVDPFVLSLQNTQKETPNQVWTNSQGAYIPNDTGTLIADGRSNDTEKNAGNTLLMQVPEFRQLINRARGLVGNEPIPGPTGSSNNNEIVENNNQERQQRQPRTTQEDMRRVADRLF